MHEYILSLGSNRGDRLGLLAEALDQLAVSGCVIDATSRIIETAPWGYTDQADFLNQAVRVSCSLLPKDMLLLCQQVEMQLGRERHIKWGPRTLDIDIIAWNGGRYHNDGLDIPHPRMQDRLFVLQPMEEICPDWIHPILQLTVEDLIKRIETKKRSEKTK